MAKVFIKRDETIIVLEKDIPLQEEIDSLTEILSTRVSVLVLTQVVEKLIKEHGLIINNIN